MLLAAGGSEAIFKAVDVQESFYFVMKRHLKERCHWETLKSIEKGRRALLKVKSNYWLKANL